MSEDHILGEDNPISRWVLKFDHFQNIHRLGSHQKKIEGAPNFRQVEGLPVFGTGQPTLESFRVLLQYIQSLGYKTIKWTNMRQEPVIYVNGNSFTPRKPDRLNENMEMEVDGQTLERLTNAFVSVIKERANQSEGKVDYFQDTYAEHPEDRVNIKHTEELKSIYSLTEVYGLLRSEGFEVSIGRLPIVDEKTPSPADFDNLVGILKDEPLETVCIFNCQMGKGRTTTGMILSCIIKEAIYGDQKVAPAVLDDSQKPPYTWIKAPEQLRQGNFGVIVDLLKFLKGAEEAKAQLDKFIDLTGHPYGLQNLRECIIWTKEKFDTEPEEKKPYWVRMGKNFVERYFYLIAFTTYARELGPSRFDKSFSWWLEQHPELTKIVNAALPDFNWL